jgi:two-component system, NarL family, response regulator NreC
MLIRLIIADDHLVVREGLVTLVEDEPDLQVVGQAATGREAVHLARKHRPELALLDITMPDMSGLEATRQIVDILPQTKILILTMHEEEAFFFEALHAGASGYLLKGAPSDELLGALRAVHEGGVYLAPQLAGNLVQDYLQHHPQSELDDSLTPRECEILTLIAQGLSSRNIAERLTLSINTVKTHRLHIYQKLNLRDRASLIDYALRRGLLRP